MYNIGKNNIDQQSLFGEQLAISATEKAIKQVEENADLLWMQEALNVVQMLSTKIDGFTTDDVWGCMAELHPNLSTHEHRAMGAVMRRALKQKLCLPTNQYIKSKRASCHCRPIRVWVGI